MSARYGVRDEVKSTAEAFYRAISHGSLKGVVALWLHSSYAAVAGPSGEMHQGWDQVAAYWQHRMQQLEGTKVSAKLHGMVCHAVGDVAWLSGTERRVVTRGEEIEREELRVTCVLQREGTNWQIVSYHASLPAEPDALLAEAS